jgi:hypothetical protein
MPLVLALFMLATMALLDAGSLPAQQALVEQARADAAATSFLAYREAVLDYLALHPGFTGTAADAALAWPWGYARDSRWSHVVQSDGSLFVYQAAGTTAPPLLIEQLQRKASRPWLLGRESGGQLVSASDASIRLPVAPAVPAGAVVLAGR